MAFIRGRQRFRLGGRGEKLFKNAPSPQSRGASGGGGTGEGAYHKNSGGGVYYTNISGGEGVPGEGPKWGGGDWGEWNTLMGVDNTTADLCFMQQTRNFAPNKPILD